MEGTGWTKAAVAFGVLAVGGLGAAFTSSHHVGPAILAAVCAAVAARCWYLGG